MARQFTKATPTTDNRLSEPKRRPVKEKPKKEKPVKESKRDRFSKRNKSNEDVNYNNTTKEEIPENKLQSKRKRTPKSSSRNDVAKQTTKEVNNESVKSFSVPAYLGYEVLDVTGVETELDMYTKLLIKTVRKKNSLGSISLISLGKVYEDIDKLAKEFLYKDGGMDDDLLTEDDDEKSTRYESKNSRVKAL